MTKTAVDIGGGEIKNETTIDSKGVSSCTGGVGERVVERGLRLEWK